MARSQYLTLVGILAMIASVACATTAQPTPAAAPPAAKSAPAAAAPTPVAKPATAAAPTSVAKPAEAAKTEAKAPAPAKTEPAWQADWNKTLEAAKKEGKVMVIGPPGDTWRAAAMEFMKAYPEIKLDWSGMGSSEYVPRILREQNAGLFVQDVLMGGGGSLIAQVKADGALQPLLPALILPEVRDNTKWHQGFDDGWADVDQRYVYAMLGYVQSPGAVNREVAPEVKSVDDLLNPKWKGRIAWQDPRRGGPGQTHLTHLLVVKSEDWVRRLLAQDIVLLQDTRQMLEGLIRGRYAAILGHRAAEYDEFKKMGLAKHIDNIYPRDVPLLSGHGSGAVSFLKNAPNPNAAKVFLNWLLSRAGQEAFTRETGNNSRHIDVTGPADTAPQPGIAYVDSGKEKYVPTRDLAIKLAAEILK